MNEDRIEGTARKVTGGFQKAAGDLAANDRLAGKGAVNQALGTVQDGYGRARETVRELLDKAPSAREIVDTGRDYYRRGSAAVTRSAVDNSGLTLLAAGVAVAAVSWLLFGRKGGKAGE